MSYAQAAAFKPHQLRAFHHIPHRIPVYNKSEIHPPTQHFNYNKFQPSHQPFGNEVFQRSPHHFGYNKFQHSTQYSGIDKRNSTDSFENKRYAHNYSHSYGPRTKNKQHRTYGSNNPKYELSPGAKLFYKLKDYANNQYSLNLAHLDSTNTRHNQKETENVIGALFTTQISVTKTLLIKQQETIIKQMAKDITNANSTLNFLIYQENRDSLLREIGELMKLRLKYIPKAEKVINYVSPNMSKRRLFKQVFPNVVNDMKSLISELNTKLTCADVQNAVPILENIPTQEIMETVSVPVQELSHTTAIAPLTQRTDQTSTGNVRKRKTEVDFTITKKRGFSRTTSLPSIQSEDSSTVSTPPMNSPMQSTSRVTVDIDSEPVCGNNTVQTVTETHIHFKTYQPISQVVPKLSTPGDTTNCLALKPDNVEACKRLIIDCKNTQINSTPDYSLLTLHGKENVNLPPSHISLQVTPSMIRGRKQQIIPKDFLFVYELLLSDVNFHNFLQTIPDFISWCKVRNVSYLITIPAQYDQQFKEHIIDIQLCEIARPFRKEIYTSPLG